MRDLQFQSFPYRTVLRITTITWLSRRSRAQTSRDIANSA